MGDFLQTADERQAGTGETKRVYGERVFIGKFRLLGEMQDLQKRAKIAVPVAGELYQEKVPVKRGHSLHQLLVPLHTRPVKINKQFGLAGGDTHQHRSEAEEGHRGGDGRG